MTPPQTHLNIVWARDHSVWTRLVQDQCNEKGLQCKDRGVCDNPTLPPPPPPPPEAAGAGASSGMGMKPAGMGLNLGALVLVPGRDAVTSPVLPTTSEPSAPLE